VEHTFDVSQDVAVPGAHDPITERLDLSRAGGVLVFTPIMLAAIDFDNQFGFAADEVDDEWSNLSLAAEVRAGQLDVLAKTLPEDALGLGRLGAHAACE